MKKTYSTPVMDVQKFDVADVITTSAAPSTAEIIAKDAQTGAVSVEIVAKW